MVGPATRGWVLRGQFGARHVPGAQCHKASIEAGTDVLHLVPPMPVNPTSWAFQAPVAGRENKR